MIPFPRSLPRMMCGLCLTAAGVAAADLDGITVAPGFRLAVFADGLKQPRTLAIREDGTVFLTQMDSGEILALKDDDGDGSADRRWVVAEDIRRPHGLVARGDALWVAESGRILRLDLDADAREKARTVVLDERTLPSGGGHWTRMLALGPDDRLYTGLGDSQNISTDDRDAVSRKRQKIWTYRQDGSDERLYCTGLRNTQKIDWHPRTGRLYGTDHGSDNFSADPVINNDNPACEFNRLEPGRDYGHPYVVTGADGKNRIRPEYADAPDIHQRMARSLPAAFALGGHVAPTGWTFYRGAGLGDDYDGAAFLCFRGSWNSTVKKGYALEAIVFQGGLPREARRIVSFLPRGGGHEQDRPVDAAQHPDGSLLFTGEVKGRIYRLTKQGDE